MSRYFIMYSEFIIAIKKDLSFHLTEKEQKLAEKMTDKDFRNYRRILLESYKNGEIPLDKIEEYLEQIKQEEKKICFNELKTNDLERLVELDAELDSKTAALILAFVKEEANEISLLGNNPEELVGTMKK